MQSGTQVQDPGGAGLIEEAGAQPERTVHITMVLDRSGSMSSIRHDVIGGCNSFIEEQKAQPGSCRLSMVLFDSQGFDYVYLSQPLDQVRPLTSDDFVPRGGTPLYDALGRSIQEADIRAKGKQGAEVQLFLILTDGFENQSQTFTRAQIMEMIETKQGEGWVFTYLGANQDAYQAGAGIGIAAGSVQNFAGTSGGTHAAYSSLSANTSGLRSAVAGGQSVNASDFYAYAGKGAEAQMTSSSHVGTEPPKTQPLGKMDLVPEVEEDKTE